jgi:hypothetical protein
LLTPGTAEKVESWGPWCVHSHLACKGQLQGSDLVGWLIQTRSLLAAQCMHCKGAPEGEDWCLWWMEWEVCHVCSVCVRVALFPFAPDMDIKPSLGFGLDLEG